jgi:hypothetical protein
MTETKEITLPESLAYYLKSTKHSEAVQSLLDQKKTPKDLGWDNLASYYHANLAAEQTRLEHWILLLQIWRATWGQHFKEEGQFGFEQSSPADYENENTQEHCWDMGRLYFYFVKETKSIVLAVSVDTEKHTVSLSFYIEEDGKKSPEYELSTDLTLNNLWQKDPDDDERVSMHGLAKLPTKAEDIIDLDQLRNAAKEAVDAIGKVLDN